MSAPDAHDNVAPLRTISGAATRLNGPVGVTLDTAGNLYVSNSGSPVDSSITVYAFGANGNVAPLSIISGASTGFNGLTFFTDYYGVGQIAPTLHAASATRSLRASCTRRCN